MPKNITNGQFRLAFSEQDKVPVDYKFLRAPTNDSLEFLRGDNLKMQSNYFIQNIRSGQFSQISENFMIASVKQKQSQQQFTTNSFEMEMKLLFLGLQEKMNKGTTFFQGLFAGMALLYTITLNLSLSVSTDLVRVEDQALRIVSILSSFGSMYSFLISNQKHNLMKIKGTSTEIDRAYKSLILCSIEMIFYTISYVIYNVSHTYAVSYNINGSNYSKLGQSTTAYTVLCLIGWIFTNINTYKYEN